MNKLAFLIKINLFRLKFEMNVKSNAISVYIRLDMLLAEIILLGLKNVSSFHS